ncbi:MAG: Acetyltransferase family protein [Myxococcales bacterium]|nr:Acetyltransferase family protein [Myxococcales bacterium]
MSADPVHDTHAPAITPAAVGDAPRLAQLHAACLPASILTELGREGLVRYYEMVTSSSLEHVLIASAGVDAPPGIAAACVLSLSPHTVLRRFALRAPGRLARDLASRAIQSGDLRERLVSRLREAVAAEPPFLQSSGADKIVPEVTQVFTDVAHRGHGLGRGLLRACEQLLRDAGHIHYCIHTLRDDNDAGIRFYRREGFILTGTSRSFGDHYLIMTKGLT